MVGTITILVNLKTGVFTFTYNHGLTIVWACERLTECRVIHQIPIHLNRLDNFAFNMSETNSMSTEPVTILAVHILIDGKDILPDVFRNEDIAKGVLVSGTHVKPRNVLTLNETTFLVTYSSGIWAKDIGSAIGKISEWLGKPVVIMRDEVTAVQLPQVIEHVCHTTRVESVVFNTGLDEMRTDSNPSILSGYHSYAGSQAELGASFTMFLNKMPVIPCFPGSEQEKDSVRFEQWLYFILDARRHFSEQLVRAAINKLCVGMQLM